MMGCDGCELWNRKAGIKICYAGNLTDRYGGENKGFPLKFELPQLFLDRLDDALRWGDLTGKDRKKKPWLNGLPRVVFLDDMGDTFTESLPIDWLAPLLPKLAESPHQWLLLTKRSFRMRQFSERHPFPKNVWPGVSVTSETTAGRINDLVAVRGGGPKWVSAEPLWGQLDLTHWLQLKNHGTYYAFCQHAIDPPMIQWVVPGGESGTDRETNLIHLRDLLAQCAAAKIACFIKQVGSNPIIEESGLDALVSKVFPQGVPKGMEIEGEYHHREVLELADAKGGDWSEWPQDIRVRQMPNAAWLREKRR